MVCLQGQPAGRLHEDSECHVAIQARSPQPRSQRQTFAGGTPDTTGHHRTPPCLDTTLHHLHCRIDLYEIKVRLRRTRPLRAALRAVLTGTHNCLTALARTCWNVVSTELPPGSAALHELRFTRQDRPNIAQGRGAGEPERQLFACLGCKQRLTTPRQDRRDHLLRR